MPKVQFASMIFFLKMAQALGSLRLYNQDTQSWYRFSCYEDSPHNSLVRMLIYNLILIFSWNKTLMSTEYLASQFWPLSFSEDYQDLNRARPRQMRLFQAFFRIDTSH
jgi:hypothetical protein